MQEASLSQCAERGLAPTGNLRKVVGPTKNQTASRFSVIPAESFSLENTKTMNNTLKLALSAVLGVALVAPAFAQDNFPDVPENHWAYGALANLKDKIVFGYPDGFYRGSRMMTRYEFAVAIDKLWKAMMAQFDDVNAKIEALEKRPTGGGSDNSDLAKQLSDLKNQVNGMKGWEGKINELDKLVKEFRPQLTELGVKVDDMMKDMADVKERLAALEGKSNAINIGGFVDLLVLAGHSSDDLRGLMPDGSVVGVGEGSYSDAVVGLDRDLNIYHSAFITLNGGKGDVTWDAILKVGNTLGLGDISTYSPGTFSSDNDTDVTFGKFAVTFNSQLAGQGVKAQIGRVGHQVSPYILKRTSFTKEYYSNAWRDSGDWYFDGGILDFMFGNVSLKVFGGQNSNLNTTNGADINPSSIYQGVLGPVDRTLGVQVQFPFGETGAVNLAYLWQDSDTRANLGGFGVVNRRNVYGADVNLTFSNINFYGSFAQSVLTENTTTRLDDDNTAYDVRLGYNSGAFGFGAGYRRVEANFDADGDWGRTGTWYNPRNVEGFNAMVSFKPSDSLKLYGKGELLQGVENGAGGFLGEDDEALSLTVGLDYKLSNFLDLGLKYEDVKFDYDAGTDPYQRWLTLMLGYSVSENAKLSFTYTYSDVDFKGRTLQGRPAANPNFDGNRFKGGLLATQLTVKF